MVIFTSAARHYAYRKTTSSPLHTSAVARPLAATKKEKCDWAFSFLEDVYNQVQFIHHTWWEQAAILELLKREDVSSQFQIYLPFEPHGGFHGYYVAREWDKAFIHFAGLREPERLRLIENLVRLAELPPARRLNTRSGLGALLNRLSGCWVKGSR